MDIKIIYLDLDMTMLRSDNTVSDGMIDMLKKCREKGIKRVITTGRSFQSSERIIKIMEPDAVICNGGALAFYGDKPIYRRLLSAEIADSLVTYLVNNPNTKKITNETVAGYFVNFVVSKKKATWIDYAHGTYTDFSTPVKSDSFKITTEITNMESALDILKKYPMCSFIPYTGGIWYRYAHMEATKWEAVKAVTAFFNEDTKNVAAFGDDYNDIEMIEKCGTGVAMGNAIDEVKAVADFVTSSNDEDGVEKWLRNVI